MNEEKLEEKLTGRRAINHLKKIGIIEYGLTPRDVVDNFDIIQQFAAAAAPLCAKNRDAVKSLLGFMSFSEINSSVLLAVSALRYSDSHDVVDQENFKFAQQALERTFTYDVYKLLYDVHKPYVEDINLNGQKDLKEHVKFFIENADSVYLLAKISKDIRDKDWLVFRALGPAVSPDLPAQLDRVERNFIKRLYSEQPKNG